MQLLSAPQYAAELLQDSDDPPMLRSAWATTFDSERKSAAFTSPFNARSEFSLAVSAACELEISTPSSLVQASKPKLRHDRPNRTTDFVIL